MGVWEALRGRRNAAPTSIQGSYDWVAIDFETANPGWDSPCAVGVACFQDGEPVLTRSWLINPEQEFYGYNVAVHGITEDRVRDEPTFPEVWSELASILDGGPVIAHYAGFDLSVLRHTVARYGLDGPAFDCFCTYVLGKRAWPGRISYRLDELLEHCLQQASELEHHDAEDDAIACGITHRLSWRRAGWIPLRRRQTVWACSPGS